MCFVYICKCVRKQTFLLFLWCKWILSSSSRDILVLGFIFIFLFLSNFYLLQIWCTLHRAVNLNARVRLYHGILCTVKLGYNDHCYCGIKNKKCFHVQGLLMFTLVRKWSHWKRLSLLGSFDKVLFITGYDCILLLHISLEVIASSQKRLLQRN